VAVLLLTGSPGVGKTTVIRAVADGLAGRRIGGFLTQEIRATRERRGFELVTFDGQRSVIAHVERRGAPRVGKYGVDVACIDAMSTAALRPRRDVDVYLVDEIGKMECLSRAFVAGVRALLDAGAPLVATIARRGGGFIADVKARGDVSLWEVTRADRETLPPRVLAWIGERTVTRSAD
jgi:nucleoside-triphosphatase